MAMVVANLTHDCIELGSAVVVKQCANGNAATNFNECGRDEKGMCYNRVCNSLENKCETHFRRSGMNNSFPLYFHSDFKHLSTLAV